MKRVLLGHRRCRAVGGDGAGCIRARGRTRLDDIQEGRARIGSPSIGWPPWHDRRTEQAQPAPSVADGQGAGQGLGPGVELRADHPGPTRIPSLQDPARADLVISTLSITPRNAPR